MKKNIKVGILLMILCTLFGAAGQFFFKKSSAQLVLHPLALITNYPLIIGLFFYGFGAILLIVSLRFGPLSLLYPLIALNFIWVMIISAVAFSEVINSFKSVAVLFIILGVVFVAGSDNG